MQSWLDQEESKIQTEQMWHKIHPDKKEDPLIIKKIWLTVILFAVFAISKSYGDIYENNFYIECPCCGCVYSIEFAKVVDMQPIKNASPKAKGKVIEGCLWKCLSCGNLQTNFSSTCVFCGSPK